MEIIMTYCLIVVENDLRLESDFRCLLHHLFQFDQITLSCAV